MHNITGPSTPTSRSASGWTPPPPSFHSPQRALRMMQVPVTAAAPSAPPTVRAPLRSKFSWASSASEVSSSYEAPLLPALHSPSPLREPSTSNTSGLSPFRGWSFDATSSRDTLPAQTSNGLTSPFKPSPTSAVSPKTRAPTTRSGSSTVRAGAPLQRSVFPDSDSELSDTEELDPNASPLAKLRSGRFFRSPASRRTSARLRTLSETSVRPDMSPVDPGMGGAVKAMGLLGHSRTPSNASHTAALSSGSDTSPASVRCASPASIASSSGAAPKPTMPDVRILGQAFGVGVGVAAPIALGPDGKREWAGAEVVRRPEDAFSHRATGTSAPVVAPRESSTSKWSPDATCTVSVEPPSAEAAPFADLLDVASYKSHKTELAVSPVISRLPFQAYSPPRPIRVGVEAPRCTQLQAQIRLAFDPRRRPRAHLGRSPSMLKGSRTAATLRRMPSSPALPPCPVKIASYGTRALPPLPLSTTASSRPRRPSASEAASSFAQEKAGKMLRALGARRPLRTPAAAPTTLPPVRPLPSLPLPEQPRSLAGSDYGSSACSSPTNARGLLRPTHTPSASRELKPLILAVRADVPLALRPQASRSNTSLLIVPAAKQTIRARRLSRNTTGSYDLSLSETDSRSSSSLCSHHQRQRRDLDVPTSESSDSGDESDVAESYVYHATHPFGLASDVTLASSPVTATLPDSALEPGSPLPPLEPAVGTHVVIGTRRGSLLSPKEELLFDVHTSPPSSAGIRRGFFASLSAENKAQYMQRRNARRHDAARAPSSVDCSEEEDEEHERSKTPDLVASRRPSATGVLASLDEVAFERNSLDEALEKWSRVAERVAL